MHLKSWFILFASVFFVILHYGQSSFDIKVFRKAKKFKKFMETLDNNFEKAIKVMDEMIFGEDNEHADEVRVIQRRMERAQKNIERIKKTSSPNFAVIKDIVRLVIEICIQLYKSTRIILRFIPVDLFFLSVLNPALNFMEQAVKIASSIEEYIQFNRRKKEYEKNEKKKKKKGKKKKKKN